MFSFAAIGLFAAMVFGWLGLTWRMFKGVTLDRE